MTQGIDLLSKILEEQSAANFRSIRPEWMLGDNEIALFEYIDNYKKRHGTMPSMDIAHEDQYLIPYMQQSFDIYREKVVDRYFTGEVKKNWKDLGSAAHNMDAERVKLILGKMNAAMLVANKNTQTILTDLQTEALASILRAKQALRSGLLGMTCGYDVFDDENGGHQKTNLDIYVGRPNTGKSYFLLRDAFINWQRGESVIFASLEMSNIQMAARLLAMYAKMSPNSFKTGEITTYQDRKLNSLVESMGNKKPFYFLSGGKKTIEDLEIAMDTVDTPLIYVDAGYLLQSKKRKSGNRADNIAYATEELKELALRTNKAIVTSVQFNRTASVKVKSKGKEADKSGDFMPDLEDIGGSDALSQQGTNIYGILPPGRDPSEQTKRTLLNMKNRDGGVGSKLEVNFKFMPRLNMDAIGVINTDRVEAQNSNDRNAQANANNVNWML